MSSSSSSAWRSSIRPWLDNVGLYYLSDGFHRHTAEAFVETGMALIDQYMKHNTIAKNDWQNLALAAALASFDLLNLRNINVHELWQKCEKKCDEDKVKRLTRQLLEEERSSSHEEKKHDVVDKEPVVAVAPPQQQQHPPTPRPASPVAASAHIVIKDEPEPEPEPAPATSNSVPPEPAPPAVDSSSDDDDEVEDGKDGPCEQHRVAVKAQPPNLQYINFVNDESKLRAWPYAFDVDLTDQLLECVSRLFRTFALSVNPCKTKQDIQNAAAASLLAVLEHKKMLPAVKPRRLVDNLYDEFPLSTRKGIQEFWEKMRATPNLVASKC